jgi:salicylate hydroxylase
MSQVLNHPGQRNQTSKLTDIQMMPHQSQAACMAIEDAAALGILFSKKYFTGDVVESLSIYESVRLPRATKVQAAAARASHNINERIGKLEAL